jgi:hypothetical protein
MKKEFLYAAIQDAQELIRFTDTKTAIGITVIAAYVATLFSMTENLVKYACCFDALLWLSLTVTFCLILICLVITARIIRPTNNPLENIKNQSGVPDLKFYLAPNEYPGLSKITFPFWNTKSYKLSESLDTFLQNLGAANDDTIEKVLSVELLKVNYIRNIKNDRFTILFNTILITSISFLIFYVHYSKQLIWIKTLLECSCCSHKL